MGHILNLGRVLGRVILFPPPVQPCGCCKIGQFPFTYLGVPLHYEKLRREDIQPIVDKIMRRIASWKGKLLSYWSRLTLLRICLASIPIYLMSIVKFPKWAIKALNSEMAIFLG
jgi:hypothetical protein